MAKTWIVPTFGVFIAWAMWSFIPKITVRYIDPASAVIYEVVGGIAVAAVALVWLDFRVAFHWKGAALAMVAGVLGFLGGFLFLVAVKRGPVSLVATVSALLKPD